MVRATLVLLASCGARMHADSPPDADEVTLYRDHALVAQRVEVAVPEAAVGTIRVAVAAGVSAQDVALVDRDGLSIAQVHVVGLAPADSQATEPTTLELAIAAPHAGHFIAELAYVTSKLRWEAGYTLTAPPSHDQATLHGSIAITNATGITFHRAHVNVVDAELGMWRGEVAERVAGTLVGASEGGHAEASPRSLGRIELPPGETRVDLLPDSRPRPMRSVLVYDPIGTKLDTDTTDPVRDVGLGVSQPASARVDESFEIDRDDTTSGLPGGPVQLVERAADGSLVVLAAARMFDRSTSKANVDTIAIGTATGVSGHRERRDISIDDAAKRLTEEFTITIDNTRPRPISVVLREHLYRSKSWTLAYYSAPRAEQEGTQQVSMHVDVPAKQSLAILYVAVYSWCPEKTTCP